LDKEEGKMPTKITVLVLAGLMSLPCLAQSNGSTPDKQPAAVAPKNFYQLNFVVRELESERVINSRSYSMILRSGNERGAIRAGEKVPYTSSTGANAMWQQIDVGVNIDCRKLEELGDRVGLSILAEISSVMENHEATSSSSLPPIIRNNRWESTVLLPIRQPTILFSSDDPASKRKMQLQLTVMPIQ
jgi:hypothetical protein